MTKRYNSSAEVTYELMLQAKGKMAQDSRSADLALAFAAEHKQSYDTERSRAGLIAKLRAKHAASVCDWLAYQDAKKRGVAWTPDEQEPAT